MLLHYSNAPVKKVNSFAQPEINDLRKHGKPRGLWVSCGQAWKNWCESEEWCISNLSHVHLVKLCADAPIVLLTTQAQCLEFEQVYQGTRGIQWQKVAEKYSGIILSPYQRHHWHDWYSTWDCSSGCIWDAQAIEEISLMESPK